MRCHACLIEKDKPEVYPYAEEDGLIDTPIDPIMEMHVQPELPEGIWRKVMLCHGCFHRVHPDLWISERCLRQIGCKTPFDALPILETQ